MKLQLIRDKNTLTSTLGQLAINGVFVCYTLEDTTREQAGQAVAEWKIKGKTAIPRGIYTVVIDKSQRFQKIMPHLLGVPGFEGVRIHSGNTADDTEGCILVGTSRGPDRISSSRLAFAGLMARLEPAHARGEPITLEII